MLTLFKYLIARTSLLISRFTDNVTIKQVSQCWLLNALAPNSTFVLSISVKNVLDCSKIVDTKDIYLFLHVIIIICLFIKLSDQESA